MISSHSPNKALHRTPAAAPLSPVSFKTLGGRATRSIVRAVVGLFLSSAVVRGAVVRVVLTDLEHGDVTHYTFDSDSSRVHQVQPATQEDLASVDTFSVGGRRLFFGPQELLKADDLLAQGRADGIQFAVVRHEYNSVANPWRALAVLSGHPIQVSQLLVLAVKDGRLVSSATLVRRLAAYHWKAKLCH